MKPLKLLLASVAILTCSTAAQAQTIVRITGSTAFRSATHNAIKNIYDSTPTIGHVGSSFTGAGQAYFFGNIAGQPVIVETGWGGSVGGVLTVSNSLPVNFLADNLKDTLTAGTTTSGLTAGTNSQIPDVAMSDTFQNSTPFNTNVMTDTPVGIVAFQWVVSRGLSSFSLNVNSTAASNTIKVIGNTSTGVTPGMSITGNASIGNGARVATVTINGADTDITLVKASDGTAFSAAATAAGVATSFAAEAPIDNITPQLAQVLYQAGQVSLATFTGNPADNAQFVFGLGRDPDSGTRLTAHAESGIGVNSVVKQWQPTVSGGAVVSHVLYPSATINGLFFDTGNNGYASGGTMMGLMGNTTSALNGHYVSYAGTGDIPTALNAGAKALTWNGVPYSLQAVVEGLYTFWGYEHLMYLPTIATDKKAVADAIANQIITVDAPIKLSQMHVSRATDGGQVIQNY